MTLRIYQPVEDDSQPKQKTPSKRIGLFGGSFDPVHNGHLTLAKACKASAHLDEVWFIPTTVQPLKPYGPVASNEDRLAMLRLAIESLPQKDQEGFSVSTIEIDRGGTSYTIDTLRTIREQDSTSELFLLMGADTLQDFQKWQEPAEVLKIATPIVVHRAGEPAPDFGVIIEYVSEEQLERFCSCVVEMPPMPISSSTIRERLQKKKPVDGEVPTSVAKYLSENSIY